tara:strand:+ start:513 stop:860 length:348 start_codon:yes stop_codon:yes gene_type:complete
MADINENPKDAVELSQEELAAKRDEITNYYKDHIPHLQAQLDYENLLRDIEKTRAERMQAQAFMTKMQAAPPAPESQATTAPNPLSPEQIAQFQAAKKKQPVVEKRTLKKEKKND